MALRERTCQNNPKGNSVMAGRRCFSERSQRGRHTARKCHCQVVKIGNPKTKLESRRESSGSKESSI